MSLKNDQWINFLLVINKYNTKFRWNLEENNVKFCNTTNLDNELQNNLEENENNDEKY